MEQTQDSADRVKRIENTFDTAENIDVSLSFVQFQTTFSCCDPLELPRDGPGALA